MHITSLKFKLINFNLKIFYNDIITQNICTQSKHLRHFFISQ